MSIFFDSRKRKPRVWTYFIFIVLPLAMLAGVYVLATKKAADRAREEKAAPEEPKY